VDALGQLAGLDLDLAEVLLLRAGAAGGEQDPQENEEAQVLHGADYRPARGKLRRSTARAAGTECSARRSLPLRGAAVGGSPPRTSAARGLAAAEVGGSRARRRGRRRLEGSPPRTSAARGRRRGRRRLEGSPPRTSAARGLAAAGRLSRAEKAE